MQVKPVKQYQMPAYPTRSILDVHPELLRLAPRRWQQCAVVMSAVIAAGAFTLLRWQPAGAETATKEQQTVSRVAPLFPKGVESRIYGLKGDMPAPTFLSEADARQVILEETKKAGLNFEMDKQTIKDLPLENPRLKDPNQAPVKLTLTLDGTDAKRNISFEYVSHTDMDEWKQPARCGYDELTVADTLRNSLEQAKPAGTYALFYDPEAGESAAAKDNLRAQVKEFLLWLKAQGVL